MNNLYQKKFWEKKKHRRPPSHPVIKAFAEPKVNYIRRVLHKSLSDKSHNTTLLDVGSGNGFLAYYFEQIYRTYSLDYSEFMLSINPCQHKICGSALDLPFANNSFDIVFCSNLLHHLKEPINAVNEMKRISRKYVILSEPNRNNPFMFLFGIFKKEERGTLKFSVTFMKRLFSQCGLKLLAATTLGMILPNKTPQSLLPVIKIIDGAYPLAFYCIVVGKK